MLIIHSHLAWANSSHFITLSMFSWNFPQIQMLDKIRRTPVGMVKPLIIFMICSIWPNAGFLSINNIIISFGKHGQTGYTLWEMVVLMQHPPVGSSARICKFCFIFTHVFFPIQLSIFVMIFHDHTPRQRSCTFSFLLRKGAGSWLGSFFAGLHFSNTPVVSGFYVA